MPACLPACLSVCLSTCLPDLGLPVCYLPLCLSACLPDLDLLVCYLPTCTDASLPACLPACLPTFLSACQPACLILVCLSPASLYRCLPACLILVCLLPACLPLCVPVSLSAFLLVWMSVSLTACVKKSGCLPACLCSDRVFLCPDNFACVLKPLMSVKGKCPRVQFTCSLCMPNTSVYTQTQKDQELCVKQLASQSFRVYFQTTDDSQIFRTRCNHERHNATLSGSLWFQHQDTRTQVCSFSYPFGP